MITVLEKTETTSDLLAPECKKGHKFSQVEQVFGRFFNIMAKNNASEINSQIHKERKRARPEEKGNVSQRKSTKLQSGS